MAVVTVIDGGFRAGRPSDGREGTRGGPCRDRDGILTTVGVFFFFGSLGYTRGVLPLHVKGLHVSDVLVGLVTAAGPAGELVMRWVSAYLLTKHGPKTIMLCCSICLACASLGYVFAASVPLLLLLTVLHGASMGGFSTGVATYLLAGADSEESRTSALSLYAVARKMADMVAPAAGLALAVSLPTRNVLMWAAVAAAMALAPLWAVRPRVTSEATSGQGPGAMLRVALHALGDKTLVGAVLAYFGWAFTMAGLRSFLPLLGRQVGIANAGSFFMASGLVVVVGTFLLSALVSRFGRNRLLYGSGVFILCSLGLILLAPAPRTLPIAGALFGLGTFVVYPCLAALAVGRLPGSTGVAVVLFMTGLDLGSSLGPFALGIIARTFGYSATLVAEATVYCLGLCAYRALSTASSGVSMSSPA